MKNELEDHSFLYLLPHEYREIANHVARKSEEQQKYIETIKEIIGNKMAEASINCDVEGRHKHLHGIYEKMIAQQVSFEDVYDILGFRIILDTVQQCYEALGVLHSIWKPIPKRFKDHIGIPKPNMYQSLHTTVIGPFGERVEIQIRTKEMDRVARYGIAAHWQYKEGEAFNEKDSQVFAWLRKLVEEQKYVQDPDEFMETVRIELFPNEVYVFTPQGDVLTLPKGATCVDFAYAIHSEVGNQCMGAKVDGRMVPLKYELKTGQRVEITTSANHRPSKDWLSFVKTAKARSRIRQHIKTEERKRSLELGREMCEKAFRRYHLSLSKHLKSGEIDKAGQDLGYKTAEDLIAGVGYGKVTPLQVVRYFVPKSELKEAKETVVSKLKKRMRGKRPKSGILVRGVDDVLIRYGKCCSPLPGDPVIGYITRGQGVTVHRKTCSHALSMDSDRRVELEWAPESDEVYPVTLHVLCQDRMGLLASITTTLSEGKANILNATVKTLANGRAECFFTVSVSGAEHLENLMKSVHRIKNVIKVSRMAA
jgi:guanosine-3',5'-bis(diphosphate) 3'-pyrophosphohydrolase